MNLQFSRDLVALTLLQRRLLGLNWTRASLLADHSGRGEDCPYARMAWREGEEEWEELVGVLDEIRTTLERIDRVMDG